MNATPFTINEDLLTRSRHVLSEKHQLYWIVGGAGSGKSTICRLLSTRFDIPYYDMDAHIYGTYHGRFTPERHPVNKAWSTAPNGLAWLLDMTWDQFNLFNQAALPEYLDLLAEDLESFESAGRLLIDGGICNPALLGRAIPARQIVCLSRPGLSSAEIWAETEERKGMKEMVSHLPNPEGAWQKFLKFDTLITQTILKESQEIQIPVCVREEMDSVDEFAEKVIGILGL